MTANRITDILFLNLIYLYLLLCLYCDYYMYNCKIGSGTCRSNFKTKYCYSLGTARALGTITITRPLVPPDN